MNINKPLSHEIKNNDINYVEIDINTDMINKKLNKKKLYKSNNNSKEIEIDEEIIENYPYEFYEEEINNSTNDKKDKEEIKQSNNKLIISEAEPQPEPDVQIGINSLNLNKLNKIKDKNNEDVIDFDADSMLITTDKNERVIFEKNKMNINKVNKEVKKEEVKSDKKTINNTEIKLNNNIVQKKIEKENSNKGNLINYSLDQDEVMDILNLNKEKEMIKNLNGENVNDEMRTIFLNELRTKKILEDLFEKEMKFKTAYAEYYSKLSETMNNEYFKGILKNSNMNIQKPAYKELINKKNINNKKSNINIIPKNNNYKNSNFNFKKNKSESNIFLNKNRMLNLAYEEYKNSKKNRNPLEEKNISNGYLRHTTIILSIRKFLEEYNISIQSRAFTDISKNPSLNYELYIDILNDLYYIDQNEYSQIFLNDSSIYKKIWNFLITFKNNQIISKEENTIESNILLLFILILNGFFNNIKIIEELEIELKWIKFENYEILIMSTEYIEENFSKLISLRKNNYLRKSKLNNNLFLNNINNKTKYGSENNSKEPDDILSEYFNSYTNNANTNFNSISNSINTIYKKSNYNNSSNKIEEYKDKNISINNNNINKQLYAFKPRNSSNNKIVDSNDEKAHTLKQNKSLNSLKIFDVNNLPIVNLINNNGFRSTLIKNKSKSKIKNKILNNNKINYNEFNSLSKSKNDNKEIHINNVINNNNNNLSNKKSSNKNSQFITSTKGKLGNYGNKVKQNRTDLKKLFKNNEYKNGTLNERLEQIKKQRNTSKPKGGKIHINYGEYTNLGKFKDKNDEQNQKPKYQFKKHTPQKKNIIIYNFKIDDKEYILEHNTDENIENEIIQLIKKNNLGQISVNSILEKIKNNKKIIQVK